MNSKIKILSVVKRKDLDETKEIFKSVIEKLCEADLSEILKIGEPTQIPNQFLFVLEVEKNIAVEVIKQLTYSGIAIVKNDPSIRAAVAEANFEIENQQANTIQRIKKEDSVKNKLQKRGNYSVEELDNLISKSEKVNSILLTTEKDYFRINEMYKQKVNYLKILVKIENRDQFIKEIKKFI